MMTIKQVTPKGEMLWECKFVEFDTQPEGARTSDDRRVYAELLDGNTLILDAGTIYVMSEGKTVSVYDLGSFDGNVNQQVPEAA